MDNFIKMLAIWLIPICVFSQNAKSLNESTQLFSSMGKGEYQYFFTFISKNKTLDVAVQPISGDTDLFVNVTSNNSQVSQYPMPSADSYEYSSMTSVLLESVHISTSGLSNCIDPCGVKIAVLCMSSECTFSVFYDQGSYLVLQPNRPSQSSGQPGNFTYFRYLKFDTKPMLILLTVLGTSNPDLYVAIDKIPNKRNATWSGESFGGESLYIDNSPLGVYFIGVYCEYKCEFTLLVSTDIKPLIQLYSGLPQYIEVQQGVSSHFFFWSYSQENLLIKTTLLVGEVVIYVNTQQPLNQEIQERIPRDDFFTWRSFESSNQENRIFIFENDRNFCKDCNFVISVFAKQTSTFLITAQNEQFLEVLQPGVPVHGIVSGNTIDSYMFTLDSTNDIEIRMQVYSGDADLFIDTNTPVSKEFYRWSSALTYDEEVIKIPISDKNWVLGTYFIAVNGWETSSYSLMVLVKNSVNLLVAGVHRQYSLFIPMNFYLNTLKNHHYTCTVTGLHEDLHPFIYVNIDSDRPQIPTKEVYQIAYEDINLYDRILNTFSFRLYDSIDTIVAISVHLNVNVKSPYFTIGCVTPEVPIIIQEHSYSFFALTDYNMQFQLFTLNEHDIELNLEFCRGEFTLQVTTDPTRNGQEPSISIVHYENRIIGTIHKPSGTYYLKVHGRPGDSFELFTEVSNNNNLQPGGDLLYSEQSGKILLSWPKALINFEESIEILQYYIYTANEFSIELYTACALKILEKKNKAQLVGVVTENSAVLEVNETTYVNVVAVLGKNRMSKGGYAIYEPIMVEKSENDSETELTWWEAILAFLIILIFAYIKHRKNSQRPAPSSGYELSPL